MIRLNLTVSDELNQALERIASESQTSKSEILRKAITLYEVARDGRKQGNKVGLVSPQNNQLVTEIIGL